MTKNLSFQNSRADRVGLTVTSRDGYILQIPSRGAVSMSLRWALGAAPCIWVALDLAGARITCVPWDQLGYSQVDNQLLTHLAPWSGVYGITFVLIAANALLAGGLLLRLRDA